MDKIDFEFDGKQYSVRKPRSADYKQANKVYNSTFKEALDAKSLLKAELDLELEKRGLWSKELEQEREALYKELADAELELAKGGKISHLKDVAFAIAEIRQKIKKMSMVAIEMESMTAEGQADNAKFTALLAVCIQDENGNQLYKTYDEYIEKSSFEFSLVAGQKFGQLIHGIDGDFEKKRPENEFLLKFKFVNENLERINKDGHLIDDQGRLINKEYQYVNDKEETVDKYGRRVDADGKLIVDFAGYTDDEGNPVAS